MTFPEELILKDLSLKSIGNVAEEFRKGHEIPADTERYVLPGHRPRKYKVRTDGPSSGMIGYTSFFSGVDGHITYDAPFAFVLTADELPVAWTTFHLLGRGDVLVMQYQGRKGMAKYLDLRWEEMFIDLAADYGSQNSFSRILSLPSHENYHEKVKFTERGKRRYDQIPEKMGFALSEDRRYWVHDLPLVK